MAQYKISYRELHFRFVAIECIFDCKEDEELILQLPAWRPGRYELGNFAQNIRKFNIIDSQGNKIRYQKLTKDSWKVFCAQSQSITVSYEYYSNVLNAGSTWIDDDQLYVNPVNCLLYILDRQFQPCQMKVEVPENFVIACGLKSDLDDDKLLLADDFHQLVDSPFIASKNILHHRFRECEVDFHLWFQGLCKPDVYKIEEDFRKFIRHQVDAFGVFPNRDYHFLFHIPPYSHYHGVEHLNSTVIVLGPASLVFDSKLYEEFLSISSHELYHAWNIKSIRPKTLLPYDYTKENYTELGYVAEGVTTYYGELCLAGAKVLNEQWFYEEIETWITRYLQNFGRENYSITDSSFDTWLDGYKPGVPHRKISIYNEGALLAMLADLVIIKYSDAQYSLDDVMRSLYQNYALQNKGYTSEDYKSLLEEFSGKSFDQYYFNYISGTNDFLSELIEFLGEFGLDVIINSSKNTSESNFGFKTVEKNGTWTIVDIAPDSPAFYSGLLIGDEIVAINNIKADGNFQNTLSMFGEEEVEFHIFSDSKLKSLKIVGKEDFYFPSVVVKKVNSNLSEKLYNKWIFRE